MYRIRRFGVVQTATTFAAIYFFVVALFAIPLTLIVATARNNSAGALAIVVFALVGAAVYGLVGWVITAIGCVLYNVVSGWVGGIEVQIDPVAPPPPPPAWGPITSTTPPPAPPSWGPTNPNDEPPAPPAPSS